MSGQPNLDPEQAMTMAKEEVLYRVDLFNSMSASCFDKCMSKPHKESDLNVGENSCVDRCVAKYWQVVSTVGALLGNNSQQQAGGGQ